MAENERYETLQVSVEEMDAAMAADKAATVHDGRFGERFDDEIHIPSVVWVVVGIAVTTAVGFLVALGIYEWRIAAAEAEAPRPAMVLEEAAERRLPSGPRLQSRPESELEAMRREMDEHLNGYGWTNEGLGLVHIPIDEAMDRVLEQGLPKATAPPTAEAPAAEDTP